MGSVATAGKRTEETSRLRMTLVATPQRPRRVTQPMAASYPSPDRDVMTPGAAVVSRARREEGCDIEAETATQTLHRLTSYEPAREWTDPVDDPRLLRDFVVNDVARFPWPYKRYPAELERLPLPREVPSTSASTVDVLAGTADVESRSIDLAHLSRILYLTAGVVRTTERPYGTWFFRAAGSAGGRFPLELYVVVPEGSGSLPAGTHWYEPLDHALVRVGPPPRSSGPAIVTTGVAWRTGWRYRERGFRHVYWDAGTALSQLLAAAESSGVTPRLFTRFPDLDLATLVGADGVHEWPVAVVSLAEGDPDVEAAAPATPGAVDAEPLEFPLATLAQHAGDLDTFGPALDAGDPVDVPIHDSQPVERVVLARGSQRLMDPERSLSRDVLVTAMRAAMRGIDVPHFVVVHAVDALDAGIYRWPELAQPVRAENLREELFRVSLDQGLARDAAFVVIGATDVGSLDDRGYREAQLHAGVVEGRLHLLAYALGASASGMTFLDSEIPELLGERLDGLLFTCVGVPEYTATPGGTPGTPTAVRMIEAR
jgi:hypothetical protein